MKTKRVCILIWNLGLGGVQKRVRDIVIDIDKNFPGWQVYLLVKYKEESHFADAIHRKTRADVRYYTTSHKRSHALSSVVWIARQLLLIRPDVCLTFLDHLSILLVSLRRLLCLRSMRVVLNEGALTSRFIVLNRNAFWGALVRLSYRHADRIIVPTEAGKLDLARHFGVPVGKVRVIPNWTLVSPLPPQSSRYDFIYVGRFEKEKNVMALIPFMEKIHAFRKNCSIALVGRGRQEQALREGFQKGGLSDHAHFFSFREDVFSIMRQSRILLLPSLNEGMPNVVLEAAMCAVPPVVANFPGAAEIITNGRTGFISDALEDMVRDAARLLSDNRLRRRIGRAIQAHVIGRHHADIQRKFISEVLAE